jgi:hypothetical protein
VMDPRALYMSMLMLEYVLYSNRVFIEWAHNAIVKGPILGSPAIVVKNPMVDPKHVPVAGQISPFHTSAA